MLIEGDRMKDDKTIARIRAVRHRFSLKFGHDVEKMMKHYIKLQGRHKGRLLSSKILVSAH